MSCFHTQCEKNLHNSGFGCFPTDPDLPDIKQTEFPAKLVAQCKTIMDMNTIQCAMCWYVPITLLFQIPRNTFTLTELWDMKEKDYFNRIHVASGDLIIMSRPKLHPHQSPWKLRFLQIPLNIKCLIISLFLLVWQVYITPRMPYPIERLTVQFYTLFYPHFQRKLQGVFVKIFGNISEWGWAW